MPTRSDAPIKQRAYPKKKLTGDFHIFGKFGFSEGVAGHISVRDPEKPDPFWVNPLNVSFNRMMPGTLLLVNPLLRSNPYDYVRAMRS